MNPLMSHRCRTEAAGSILEAVLRDQPAPTTPSPPFQRALSLLGLPEPRRSPRISCRLPVTFQTVTVEVPTWGTGHIVDLSPQGAGVRTRIPIEPGNFLALRLGCSVPGVQPLLLRVIHAREVPGGGHQLGGAWMRPLSRCQLAAFLDGATTSK